MTEYILTGDKFSGEISLRYNDKGYLVNYQSRAELNEEQQVWFLRKLPRELGALKELVGVTPTLKLCLVPDKEPMFEDFWHRYDDKALSSKKRAQKAWERLSRADKIKAYKHIHTYFNALPQGTRKKYAETYINAELWNN